MNKSIRRILLIVSVLAFVSIAPAIVLYAVGYRPPEDGTIFPESVGVLLIDAIPAESVVEVDGEVLGNVPRASANLRPGDVRVKVAREGYIPWEKTLSILPVKATEVRDIRLFPTTPEREQVLEGVRDFSLSPNRSLIAAVTDNQTLQIFSRDEKVLVSPVPLAAFPTSVLWSPDSNLVLLEYPGDTHSVVDITQRQGRVVPLPDLRGADAIQWDPRVPGRLFYIDDAQSLRSMDISTRLSTTLLENVTAFGVSSRNLHVAVGGTQYAVYGLQGQSKRDQRIFDTSVQSLAVTPAGSVAVRFEDGSVDILDDEREEIARFAEKISWSPDGRMLLLQTANNELQVYNVENERRFDIPKNQLHLVVRLSRPITHAQWFAGGNHLIYQVDDQIMVTEIDTRDYPVSHTVDSTNTGDARFAVGEDGETLLYLKRDGDSQNLVLTHLLTQQDR